MSSEKVIDSLFSSYDNFDLIGNSCDIYRLKKFNKRTNVKKPEHQKTVDQPMTNNSRSFQNVFLATFSEKHWEIRTPPQYLRLVASLLAQSWSSRPRIASSEFLQHSIRWKETIGCL